MRLILILTFAFGLLLAAWPAPLVAQGITGLLSSAEQKSDVPELEAIIDRAAQNGVSVVVIDNAGNLLAQIDDNPVAEAATVDPDGSALMKLQDQSVKFRSALIERILQFPNSLNEVLFILRAASPDGTLTAYALTLLYSLMMLAVGYAFEKLIFAKHIAKRLVIVRVRAAPEGYAEKMPFLVFRFFMGVVAILVSMAVAYAVGITIFGTIQDTAMQFTVTLINIGYFACRMTANLWRMILSPQLGQYRIPVFSEHDAVRLHRWLVVMACSDIIAQLFGAWISELGLNYDVYAFIASMLSAFIVVAHIMLVLVNGRAISGAMRNGCNINECSMLIRFLSTAWGPLVVAYVVFAWFSLTYDLVLEHPSSVPLIAGAYAILISIIVVYGVINFLIERSFSRARALRRMNEVREEEEASQAALVAAELAQYAGAPGDIERLTDALEESRAAVEAEEEKSERPVRQPMNTFEALARRVAGILAFVAGAYAFFYIWDNGSALMVESYVNRLLDVMVVIFIGYIVYHVFRIWIDSKILEEVGDEVEAELGDEGGGSSASRLATLLPLFRNFMLIVVVVTIALITLMEIGINVGPLFAGAGIVGVAVGFGSQALVRDIFAGAFFLFDDAFRKGEYLDVGGVKGTVEKISVRSFQLRHHLGALHTIPFGELQVMTNYSRDWVMMKLPLRVTYDTDVDHVRKLVKKLGQQLLEDPVIGSDFLQPLKSQGVIEMQDSAMIIRVKFMTKPGDQWVVRKRVYEEIRVLFEREGIKFAHREVTVRLADGKVDELSEDEKSTLTAAAQASIEEDALDGDMSDDDGDDR